MVLLILVDALSSEYLNEENTPFLFNWAQKNTYVKKIHASCGYCERTEVFTGMYPKTSKNFTAIGYSQEEKIYKKGLLLKSMSLLDKVSKRNARRVFNIYSKLTKKKMLGYQIPFQILHKFSLTEDEYLHDCDNAFVGESIFTVLKKNKMRYSFDVFTALGSANPLTDIQRVEMVKQMLYEDYSFIPMYIGMVDTIGHKYSNDDIEMKKCLNIVDKMLESIIVEAEKIKDKKIDIMVLGDHGMECVTETVNFEDILDKIPLRKFVDYDYFLDSTIARFWINKDCNREIIVKEIQKQIGDKGYWMSLDMAEKYNIPFDSSRTYGDLIWCAKTGVLIYPDFFNKYIDAGMHGYAIPTDRGKGLCIFTGKRQIIQERNLVDVCPTLCDLLNMSIPNMCEGTSFYGGKK